MGDPVPAPWVIVSAAIHEQGGQAKALASLVRYLDAHYHPVHLVCHDLDPSLARRPRITVYPVPRPLGMDLLGYCSLRQDGYQVADGLSQDDPRTRVVVNGGCCPWADINWVHYLHHAWAPPPTRAGLLAHAKNQLADRLFRRHERTGLTRARLVIANSERTRQDILATLPVPAHQVHTVYYGSDPAWTPATPEERAAGRRWLAVSDDRPLVLFVGGLGSDERKGFDTLWTAWQELCRDPGWDADLIIAGGGRSLETWRQRVAATGLDDRIRFLGFIHRVLDLLAAGDLLVSPVRYEAYGLNVHEAVCRGLPALVSASAGVAEVYPAELRTMLLPAPDDAGELVLRLRSWRNDLAGFRERFAAFGDTLRARTWDVMASELTTLARQAAPVAVRS